VTLAQKCSALCKSLHNRKNWIHFGSRAAGPRIAAILSIVETCRRLKIPTRDYLASILPGLADFPVRRIAALTPTTWAARF
jgi:transposase